MKTTHTRSWPVLALAALVTTAPLAQAHVVLEQTQAVAGSNIRATFRVGHGCGDLATTAISVRIPRGVLGAKPMPKPGWTLTTRKATLAEPYKSHGKTYHEDVAEVTWTARTPEDALPDAHYDEFVLRATLPATAQTLWFAVLQTCATPGGMERQDWAQIPASGTSTQGLRYPAARLDVVAPPPKAEHSHH